MPPRASLKAFLVTARAALTTHSSKRTTPLTFVVGNESADLDSLCSALLLAYFHTYAPPKPRAALGDGSPGLVGTLHIPVCHLRRADLALRPEFAAVLRDAGVGGEDVFTLEDVLPPPTTTTRPSSPAATTGFRPEDTRWVLVDHNAMTGALAAAFSARVVGCVDHHADEGVVPPDAAPRVIEKSGSCASLVLRHCADVWEALAAAGDGDTRAGGAGKKEEEEDARIDAQIAALALAPILVDTANLADRSKTTPHDERAVALAEARIAAVMAEGDVEAEGKRGGKAGEKRYDRTALFARLAALKEDIAALSLRDVLRKDYKEWRVGGAGLGLGTASVPRGLGYLVREKAGGSGGAFAAALRDWGVERDAPGKMDVLVLLTTSRDAAGRFCRELVVQARSEAGVKAARLFEARCAGTLRLETWGGGALDETGRGSTEWRRCWVQRAVEHSRKQIAPMLRDALEEVAGCG
ncbi:exopolyphosphatase-like protein [Ustulina deusta]|nr:exopolyphosphatase-like protein [Ustulina deusta]